MNSADERFWLEMGMRLTLELFRDGLIEGPVYFLYGDKLLGTQDEWNPYGVILWSQLVNVERFRTRNIAFAFAYLTSGPRERDGELKDFWKDIEYELRIESEADRYGHPRTILGIKGRKVVAFEDVYLIYVNDEYVARMLRHRSEEIRSAAYFIYGPREKWSENL